MIVRPVPNKMAVWAMWMGIVGIGGGFVCGLLSMMPIIGVVFGIVAMFLWVAPVLAVIFGHIGLSQIKRTGEDGHGQAVAGLIMGYVSIAIGLVRLILVIGLFGVGFLAMIGSYCNASAEVGPAQRRLGGDRGQPGRLGVRFRSRHRWCRTATRFGHRALRASIAWEPDIGGPADRSLGRRPSLSERN